MSNTVNTQVRGPLVDGLVLEVSDRGRSGFKGVSQRFDGAQAVYFAALDPATIRAGGGDPTLWPQAIGGRVSLGYYKDPRIPAYLHALAHSEPSRLVALFNGITVVAGGTSLKQLVDRDGALATNLPAELWTVPTDYADLMRNYPAGKRVVAAKAVARTESTMVQWSQLLKDYGTTGEAVWKRLGGTPADQAFVLSLRTLGYDQALVALAQRGVDLAIR